MKNNQLIRPQLTYYSLHPCIKAFSSTRKGGISTGCYGEFNINAYCGDSTEAVNINRKALCKELQLAYNSLLIPHQTHGVEVRAIEQAYFTLPLATQTMLLDGVDALITSLPNICIGVSTADCIPVLLYDEKKHCAAAIHAGWRGTVKRIVKKTIIAMQKIYGTQPSDIFACIGPGISLKHFEVGNDVYEEFVRAGFAMSSISMRQEKWHLNLPKCNYLQLLACGVKKTNILNTDICTYEHVGEYFSARRLGVQSGRIYSGVILL